LVNQNKPTLTKKEADFRKNNLHYANHLTIVLVAPEGVAGANATAAIFYREEPLTQKTAQISQSHLNRSLNTRIF